MICQYILETPISICHSTAVNKDVFGLQIATQRQTGHQINYCCKLCADIPCEGVRKWDNTAKVIWQISDNNTQ